MKLKKVIMISGVVIAKAVHASVRRSNSYPSERVILYIHTVVLHSNFSIM